MLGLEPHVIVLVAIAVGAGALVQSVVGIGLGLVVAPVVAVLAPELAPELPLWLALWVATTSLVVEHSSVDWGAVMWALPARIPGTALGVLMVGGLSPNALGIVIAVVVWVAVLITVWAPRFEPTRTAWVAAGMASGALGTATSIGGPPIALVAQHWEPARARATLAVFFVGGVVLSLAGLAIGGHDVGRTFPLAVVLAPCVAVGMGAGGWVRTRVDHAQFRRGVLAVCALSATVLLVRSMV